jgi:hypothetical protein
MVIKMCQGCINKSKGSGDSSDIYYNHRVAEVSYEGINSSGNYSFGAYQVKYNA